MRRPKGRARFREGGDNKVRISVTNCNGGEKGVSRVKRQIIFEKVVCARGR